MLGEAPGFDLPHQEPPRPANEASAADGDEETTSSEVTEADDYVPARPFAEVEVLCRQHIPFADALAHEASRRVGDRIAPRLLVSAARQGLWRAALRFDAARGVPFEVFARRRITGALVDELRAERIAWRVRGEGGPSPNVVAMLGACSYATKPEELHNATDVAWLTSWRAELGVRMLPVGGVVSLSGLIDEDQRPADEQLERAELIASVRAAIAQLDPRKRALVEGVFDRQLSLEAAGGGVSKSWGSRLLDAALEELRVAMAREGVCW
jgi:RNA polymerase sigma factor for flagellar operon FliA